MNVCTNPEVGAAAFAGVRQAGLRPEGGSFVQTKHLMKSVKTAFLFCPPPSSKGAERVTDCLSAPKNRPASGTDKACPELQRCVVIVAAPKNVTACLSIGYW